MLRSNLRLAEELLSIVRMLLDGRMQRHEVKVYHTLHERHMQLLRVLNRSLQPLLRHLGATPTNQIVHSSLGRCNDRPRTTRTRTRTQRQSRQISRAAVYCAQRRKCCPARESGGAAGANSPREMREFGECLHAVERVESQVKQIRVDCSAGGAGDNTTSMSATQGLGHPGRRVNDGSAVPQQLNKNFAVRRVPKAHTRP
jgi:hypothetical protein